jgi:hypothetical protein
VFFGSGEISKAFSNSPRDSASLLLRRLNRLLPMLSRSLRGGELQNAQNIETQEHRQTALPRHSEFETALTPFE